MSNSKKIVIGVVSGNGTVNVWTNGSEEVNALRESLRSQINVVYTKEFGYQTYDAKTGILGATKYMVTYGDRFDPRAHEAALKSGVGGKQYAISDMAKSFMDRFGMSEIEAVRKEQAEIKKFEKAQAKKNS